ncbi:MAG TPA: phosphodiesterase [Burkholderiales bacterium]|nr:phosphodiesterase [Burkholderiales bacterium]
MSQSIPPNSSSDGGAEAPDRAAAAAPEQQRDTGLEALVERLAEALGADSATLARVASLFADVRERAPDLFVPAAGALASALEEIGKSEGAGAAPLYAALGEWALDAEGEPIERMRRDCLRFQAAMTRGALRLYAGDTAYCTEILLALQRFVFLQLATLASLSARGAEGGGVVRTLPTPEYAAFMDIFRAAIESHKQEGKQLALLLIQVARVEQVDRLLGLQRGEAFMLRVARRMREGVLRKQDQLGRVSRDQFACLLPRIAGEGVAVLAANKILGALEAPIPIGERSFPPDAVVGIALYPEHGEDPQTLVRNGKLAARAARAAPERTALYDPAHGESEERRMQYEARLRLALEEGLLDLEFEPELDLGTGRIGGFRCRLRWKDKLLGDVPEAQAIETAESSGLARELTWWMFNNALRTWTEFARVGLQCPIGVTVPAGALLLPDFPDFVSRALRTWGVPPRQLVIGISETALAGGLEQVKEALSRLKTYGVRIVVDDFGTGSSSLSRLAQLPLDELKVSAEFASDMVRIPLHGKIVRSLVQLAKTLGLHVTAEGVTNGETAVALMGLGCERVRGEYVSPPLTAQQIIELEKGSAGLTKIRISDL